MLKPIKSNQQYEDASARTYALMQKANKRGSKNSDELEVLSMIRKLNQALHIPAEVLTMTY